MIINVTQEHIDRGIRLDPCNCPIALALKDAGYADPRVCVAHITWMENPCLLGIYPNPPYVVDFIRTFDHNKAVQPFSFELEAPQ